MARGSVPLWQPLALSGILGFVLASTFLCLTRRIRSIAQPWVTSRVKSETKLVLQIQRWHNRHLDNFFSVLSFIVSVPFYTGFLPLLDWSGHCKLSRQMTLLMAFCNYLGNSIKDAVSASRPSSPPVKRITATEDEKEYAMEYGFPSTHALNTVCLLGYLLNYVTTNAHDVNHFTVLIGFFSCFFLISLVGLGRIYLGMHSFIDVAAGITIGLVILAFWLVVDEHIDEFLTSGQNVVYFSVNLFFLMLFAYPTPEVPTPSFSYHTAFNGVAFGLVIGIQQTHLLTHSESIPLLFSPELPLLVFVGRIATGIPAILLVKFSSRALAKWLLPVICNTLGIPVRSSCYVPSLKEPNSSNNMPAHKPNTYLQRIALLPHKAYDVDTGIRFLQYAGLAWSSLVLVPYVFYCLNL